MENDVTREECIAKCKEAAFLINEKGLDAAIEIIDDNNGPFVWKDTYVFVMNLEGKMLAHPKSELLGLNLLLMRDENDSLLFQDMIDIAQNSGEGWIDYLWPRPGEEEATRKSSYILRITGQDIFVGAGIYQGYQLRLEPFIRPKDLTCFDFCQWEFPMQELSHFHIAM